MGRFWMIAGCAAGLLAGPRAQAKAPEVFRGIYLTSFSAGSRARVNEVLNMARRTGLNAVVIDIKDATGFVDYATSVPDVKRYGALRVTVRDMPGLIARLHQAGLYVVARQMVFEDPRLAAARPDLAVKGADGVTLWTDRKGLSWVDPAARDVWEYNAAVTRDARRQGFDEINFDYVRFPTDGNLENMRFPVYQHAQPMRDVLRSFFAYLRKGLPGITISADVFGLATVNHGDLGIGQVIEDAYRYFDYVCPMTYPSLYASGFLRFENPGEHPYDVVNYSLRTALKRLPAGERARLRPWVQAFSLHATYTPEMMLAQIQGIRDALGSSYAGYTLWSPGNHYPPQALQPLDVKTVPAA